MLFKVFLRTSCICVLLFSIGTCYPPQKSQSSGGSGYDSGASESGSGYDSGASGSGSGYESGASGSGSGYGSGASGSGSGYGSGASGSGSGYGSGASGSGSGYGSGASGSGYGSGFNAGLSEQAANFARFLAALMSLKKDRSYPQYAWSSNQVPKGTSEMHTVYPSTHIVHSTGGYQRARDSSSYAKYSQDTFDHIAVPDTDSKTGSKGQKFL